MNLAGALFLLKMLSAVALFFSSMIVMVSSWSEAHFRVAMIGMVVSTITFWGFGYITRKYAVTEADTVYIQFLKERQSKKLLKRLLTVSLAVAIILAYLMIFLSSF